MHIGVFHFPIMDRVAWLVWGLLGILLIAHVSAKDRQFVDPCRTGVEVKSDESEVHSNLNETRKSLSDLIKFSVDYKVDPCEDFYQFACGNWIRNAPEPSTAWQEHLKFDVMAKHYEEDIREAIRSVENSPSKAVTQAAALYDKCMAAEDEWKQNGVTMIHFLWKKIKEYGDFPMLSEKRMSEAEINKKFDFTWLLAYFNSNRTILHSILPRVAYAESYSTGFLTFYPRNNIFSFIRGGIRGAIKTHFIEFLLDLMKTVAVDVGVDYSKTIAAKDIVNMVDFMEALYAVKVPDLVTLLKNQNFIKVEKIFRLSEVDYKTLHVNWTEYLLLVAPVEVHFYIRANPEVVADTDYVRSIDEVLQSATPRTLTNFVITHYIFSWLTVLEAKYRKLIHRFATNVGSRIPQRRSEVCFDLIKDSYRHVVLAMYARSKKYGNGTKPIIEEMIREIVASFKDQLNKNEWMGDEFRKGVFKKLDYMKSTLLYDEISTNDTALDNLYFEQLKIKYKELSFLTMLDEVMYVEKKMLFYKLGQRFDAKKTFTTIAAQSNNPINAFYMPPANTFMIPLGIVQYPIFDLTFPRAFNYGSIGFITAHEISHGFDNEGIRYDYTGTRKKWYNDEWIREFDEKIECYIEQYNNKTIPIFDEPLNGTKTLQDNVADNEGMKIAYMAFKKHQDKHGEEARTDFVEDFTNDQLFFLSFAMAFCAKTSDLTLYYELRHSEHASNVYRALHGIPLLTKAFVENQTFENPCRYEVNVNNHDNEERRNTYEKRESLSDLIKSSVDYKVDPCEDFYQFACGNWIRNVRYKPAPMEEYAKFDVLSEHYQEDMKEALRSVENSTSKAITQAATLYDKCMSAEEEWKQKGILMIHFLWKKIKEYGDFPMLSEKRMNDTEISEKFNFTWLLAFFNRNKTVLHSIVPRVIYHEAMPSALLTFYPQNNIFTFMEDGMKTGVKEHFTEFMFNLIETVAADVGVDYGKTIAPKDIVDMVDFMEKLYATPVFDLNYWMRQYRTFGPDDKVRLFQVDNDTFHVNWTEYLLLVAPVEVHHYILSNPDIVADTAYVKRIDKALESATPRTLTNFVITHYILSWLPALEAKYRKLIHTFVTSIGSTIPQKRSEVCYDLINDNYRHALLAMYARSKKYGNGTKAYLEEMIGEIIASYKDQLNENKWIGDNFRKGAFKKLDNMKSTLLYDEVSVNDTALDDLYLEYLKIKDKELPFLAMTDEAMYAKKKTLFYKLIQKLDIKKEFTAIAAHSYNPISALYLPFANTIMILSGYVQYPTFDLTFPRAFNYGSIGFITAHEILHGFDNRGIHYDHTGTYTKWYTDEWIQKFNKIIMCYVKQYNNKTIPIFNIRLNGTLSLSENISDNEGMKVAYKAFKKHQEKYGEGARTDFVEDFTNDQLFFLSFAMTWCTKTSDLMLYYERFNFYASKVFRVNNVALNTPAFASSFFCPPGSPMNPHHRCSVW